ncbi:hypothetical protein HN873_058943 [Arachis hypogaea]
MRIQNPKIWIVLPPPFISLPPLPPSLLRQRVTRWSYEWRTSLKHSERDFFADSVALAEEIWKVSELECLEASIKAAFEAIRSRGTNSHVVLSHYGIDWFEYKRQPKEADQVNVEGSSFDLIPNWIQSGRKT